MDVYLIWLNRLGLLFSVIGTLLLAFAVGENLEKAHQTDKKGKPVYLAIIKSPLKLKWGIILVIVGFFAQFLASFG